MPPRPAGRRRQTAREAATDSKARPSVTVASFAGAGILGAASRSQTLSRSPIRSWNQSKVAAWLPAVRPWRALHSKYSTSGSSVPPASIASSGRLCRPHSPQRDAATKRCVDPSSSGRSERRDSVLADEVFLVGSTARIASSIDTRRARPPLAAAARAAGSRQRLAGCRIGEYRTSGV